MYATRPAHPPAEEGWVEELPVHVDIHDEETKRLIGAFNSLVHKHRVAPAQTLPHDGRRAKMAALQEEAMQEAAAGLRWVSPTPARDKRLP